MRALNRQQKWRILITWLVVQSLVSAGLFTWAAQKSYSIGVNASATGGNGGGDQILWLWLALSILTLATSAVGLAIVLSRRSDKD
jgi:hypothetical protein